VKTPLRLLALILFVAALGYWTIAGANRGWTKTSIPVKTMDDVTGIEGITYQKKFIPGVDFMAAAAGVAIMLAGASFLFRTKHNPQASNKQTRALTEKM
jgi:hypothetical protein